MKRKDWKWSEIENLPTDEEVSKAWAGIGDKNLQLRAFSYGAKWMRDKLMERIIQMKE